MNRRSLFVGAAAIVTFPIASAVASVPVPISDVGAEDAFALGFKHAPTLTWGWGEGFSLGGKPVTDAEATQWDASAAHRIRLLGEERHKQRFRKALRAEFHREYGPRKADSYPLPALDADDLVSRAATEAWERADAADLAAWRKFLDERKTAGLLPGWYLTEIQRVA